MTDTLATTSAAVGSTSLPSRARQFYALTKPRVVQLIVFCAVIGMLMATPGLPDLRLALAATAGIWLVAAAAAAFNCVVEQRIDARMARTAWRPTARGQLTNTQTLTNRKPVIDRFMKAYRETIDWLYSNDPAGLKTYADFVDISIDMARRTRDEFFPRAAVDPDRIVGLDTIVPDAVALKFTAAPLTKEQLAELIQIPPR